MVQLAVVGCGYWGPNLIRNIIAGPSTNLVWACDLDATRLKSVLAPYPGIKGTTDFQDILNDPAIDGVVIATPVSAHYPLAKLCLENGKHVFLEKPMTRSVAEAEKLLQLADEKNLQIMSDHTFCYTGAVRKIKEIVTNGMLGDTLYYDSIRINLGLFQTDVNVIWDLAIHDLAIVDFIFGAQPLSVNAIGTVHAGSHESIAYLSVNYSNSFIAHFHVNWLAPVKIRKTIIGGSKKMIEWNDLVPAEKIKIYDKGINLPPDNKEEEKQLRISYRSGDIHSPHIDNTEALALVIQEFADSITENRTPLTDGKAGLRILKILEAADKSLKAKGMNIPLDS